MINNMRIKLLYSDSDLDEIKPIIEQLKSKGLHTSDTGENLSKNDTVLTILSESFCNDRGLTEKLLSLVSAGAKNVLPLQIDSFSLPDTLKNALYSRNIITVSERDPSLIADRVIAALPRKRRRLPLFLCIAGAILLALIALLLWRSSMQGKAIVKDVHESAYIPDTIGLTAEDLAKVRCVVIVGEHFNWYTQETRLYRHDGNEWPDMLYQLASCDNRPDEEQFNWYWHEDGSKVRMTSYDLSFLSLMPNLEELHMAMVDIEHAPDLSGLTRLDVVWAYECRTQDLDWLASSHAHKMQIRCDVDYSPLTRCSNLSCAILDIFNDEYADLSTFSPLNLQEFDLVCWNQGYADLSGLSACSMLQRVRLGGVPIKDLSFLSGKRRLSDLELHNMDKLKDISVLNGMNSLRNLYINECWSIPDYSPVSGCVYLESVRIEDRSGRLIDTSFLKGHPKLTDIAVYIDRMTNLDFLEGIGANHSAINFEFAGTARDYSGLSSVENYNRLIIDPGEDILDRIVPYLDGISISELRLSRFRKVDLSILPKVKTSLTLDRCGITNLSSLPDDLKLTTLELLNCSSLRSLEGLQKLQNLGISNTGTLRIYNCPLLTDWSALSGKEFYSLEITGGFSLPSFANLHITKLRIDSVADIGDLTFLNEMSNEHSCNFELVGLDELSNLSPLNRFHGVFLAVDPRLAEQAQELVEAGNFTEFRIEYPDGGWELDLSELKLNSLEDLNELPKSMLRRIQNLSIAGDHIFDPNKYEIFEDWEHQESGDIPPVFLKDRDTGELISIVQGSITDIGILSALTGLESLDLFSQPLTDLNGIQALSSLRSFSAQFCPNLEDVSALFTLQELDSVDLRYAPVSSILGIQNLSGLVNLNINHTKITDLSPLAGCDFHHAYESGGFSISMNDLNLTEGGLDALSSIKVFLSLAFTNQDPAVWIPLLADSDIYYFGAAGDLRTNEDISAFAADHPELRSLYIGYSDKISDLTPLISLENLEDVTISPDMKEAIDSLDGKRYSFNLITNG